MFNQPTIEQITTQNPIIYEIVLHREKKEEEEEEGEQNGEKPPQYNLYFMLAKAIKITISCEREHLVRSPIF